MIGAIQALIGSNRTAEMDEIAAPHPQPYAWLEMIQSSQEGGPDEHDEATFDETDLLTKPTWQRLKGHLNLPC